MCGICGVMDYSGAGLPDGGAVSAMSGMLAHRGPDASGAHRDGSVALAHRRLSIIDLAGGAQPMCNEDATVWLAYNGEVYNFRELRADLAGKGHVFATSSDTEVIVHLYEEHGPDAVKMLNGMFAFALWDGKAGRLLLARDRMGIKPLYYASAGGAFWFSSELGPLVKYSGAARGVNTRSFCRYLLLQYPPGPETIADGVYKLPPGTYMSVERGKGAGAPVRYWEPVVRSGERPDPGLPGRILAALDGAVKRQLVSDVPLGAFLSGGLDSTAVVALMKRHRPDRIKTFSIGFEVPAAFDERAYARLAAERLGTEHYETSLDAAGFAQLMPTVLAAMDEPVADPAAVPTYKISKLAREHVTVVMTGEGGDELFGGYKRYMLERRAGGVLTGGIANMLARPLVEAVAGRDRRYVKAVRALTANAWNDAHLNWVSVFLREELEGLSPDACADGWWDTARLLSNGAGGGDSRLGRMIACDLGTWLVDDLLTKVDRMSMAVSLEARVPYLDNEVVDIALAMADADRINGNVTKHALKLAVRGVVPDEVARRAKRGFDLPLAVWFRGPLREFVYDSLSGGAISGLPVDAAYVRKMLDEHVGGLRDWALPLFSLLTFTGWAKGSGLSA